MNIRLLVVDDEQDVLEMMRDHFTLRGFEVVTASDGAEGIEICRKTAPDVILLDLKMKHMDGDEALPALRRHAPDAKIFVISAYQDEITQHRIAGLGVDAYFEKPVSLTQIAVMIDEKLTSHRCHGNS